MRRSPASFISSGSVPVIRRDGFSPDDFRPGPFGGVLRKIRTGGDISARELIEALKANAGRPLPDVVLAYVCLRLEGKIRQKAGRKRRTRAEDLLQEAWAVQLYARYLAWLQKRKRRSGLKGWPALQTLDWWQGPPAERAARMVVRRLPVFENKSWRHVLNVVSSQK